MEINTNNNFTDLKFNKTLFVSLETGGKSKLSEDLPFRERGQNELSEGLPAYQLGRG